jgi:hypothetical protein
MERNNKQSYTTHPIRTSLERAQKNKEGQGNNLLHLPFGEIWEQVWGGRMIVIPILVVGSVSPVHIESPDINWKLVCFPPFHLTLGVSFGVRVPPSKPSPESEILHSDGERPSGTRPRGEQSAGKTPVVRRQHVYTRRTSDW